jgi:hypothetical protein
MKHVSLEEQAECLDEIIKRFKEEKVYSLEDINDIAEKQLKNLSNRLYLLVESGDIEEKIVAWALGVLERRKEYSVGMAFDNHVWDNPEARYLPIMPVISEDVIDIPTLMKIIINDNKQGRSFTESEKIKTDYKGKETIELCYWVLDVRINEIRYNCPFLTAAEAIAYAFHNPDVLSGCTLNPVGSRYKRVKEDNQLLLRLIEEYPIFHWSRLDYFEPIIRLSKPSCALRLIH